jgi:hypothetical protein
VFKSFPLKKQNVDGKLKLLLMTQVFRASSQVILLCTTSFGRLVISVTYLSMKIQATEKENVRKVMKTESSLGKTRCKNCVNIVQLFLLSLKPK